MIIIRSSYIIIAIVAITISIIASRAAPADFTRRWNRNLPTPNHSCHILPFQPILWNSFFPSEPAKPPRTAPNLFQRGVEYGKYANPRHLVSWCV